MLLIPSRHLCPTSLLQLLQNSGVALATLDELTADGSAAETTLLLARYDPGKAQDKVLEQENSFCLENDFWHIRFRGATYSIKQSLGMRYIVCLIQRAYHDEPEILAAGLYYLVQGHPPVTRTALDKLTVDQLEDLGLSVADLGDGMDVITTEGKERVKGQIKELDLQIRESEEDGNMDEVFLLREKKEAIEDYIKKASGLGGRGRKGANPTKRARQAVSKSIKNTLANMQKKDGVELAAYIKDHCKLGHSCSFRKDTSIPWQIVQKKMGG